MREALEPLRENLGEEAVHRLSLAIRSACGIETRVWLGDIAQLPPDEIRALQLWMAHALLAHAIKDAPPMSGDGGDRPRQDVNI